MFVLDKSRGYVVNIAHADSVYIGEDRRTIKSIVGNMSKMYRLGFYSCESEAEVVLEDLFCAMGRGQATYKMPDSQQAELLARAKGEEKPLKFASNGKKPVRRGGS